MKKFIVSASLLLSFAVSAYAAPAAPASKWDITHIGSTGGDRPNVWDTVGFSTSTHWNHDGDIYTIVQVTGYSNPVVTYNNGQMQLIDTAGHDTNSDGFIDVWQYLYVNSGPSGNIEVKDWLNSSFAVRDRVFVQ